MAVGASDAGSMHSALNERAVSIDLIALLAIGMIKPGLEQ